MRHDHHCHWLGTCIGLGNYNVYCLFVFYGTALIFFAAAVVLFGGIYPLTQSDFSGYRVLYSPRWHLAVSIPVALLWSFLMLFFGSLCKLHAMLLATGITCREHYLHTEFPVDTDNWVQNIKEVFGDNWMTWAIPFTMHELYLNGSSWILGYKAGWKALKKQNA